ncbi:MAG: CRISPR-associated helicase Cas3' [Hyphomicrobiaceae bacterium]
MKLFARTTDGPEAEWEALEDHLRDVATLAARFAAKFGAAEYGEAAGLLHDLGKAKPEWQRYLRGLQKALPHASEGALAAARHFTRQHRATRAGIGRMLAFVIAGHHAGLANGAAAGSGIMPLDDRLSDAMALKPLFSMPELKADPEPLRSASTDAFALAFFIRMLFSALVDADRLVSERFDNASHDLPDQRSFTATLHSLKTALDTHLIQRFGASGEADDLAKLRAEVASDCRASAKLDPGFFTLTVPTGGGKTLSSLAFALEHAARHPNRFDRVISVIPFTSIIEQTAEVFRLALGNADAVLEHHSAFDDAKLDRHLASEDNYCRERLRLASQNWDRPIVVTTAVQFYESLYSNTPKRCRKLHNIARSVIVLDEAQTLPLNLLRPCVAALKELVRGYGCTVVICTATQPVLTKDQFQSALPTTPPPREMPEGRAVREIVRADRNLFQRLQRVRAERVGQLTDSELVEAISATSQGLVIVNNRRHARELFALMQAADLPGGCHLSTAMTAAHRQHAMKHIRANLAAKRPVQLVATSLIEAGVDISFAAVWRAAAGLDQIVQAAGRCNRNGELGQLGGRLTIFDPEAKEGRGIPTELVQSAEATARVLARGLDPLSPEAVQAYFEELLWCRSDDGKWTALDDVQVGERGVRGIMSAIAEDAPRMNFGFADIAAAFRMIDQTMVPVIIPASIDPLAGIADDVLERIAHVDKIGGIMRDLQRHIVQVPRRARDRLIEAGSASAIAAEKYAEQFVRLTNRDLYTAAAGLAWDDPTYRGVMIF